MIKALSLLEDVKKSLDAIYKLSIDPKRKIDTLMKTKTIEFTLLKIDELKSKYGIDLTEEYRRIANDFLPSPLEKIQYMMMLTDVAIKASQIQNPYNIKEEK